MLAHAMGMTSQLCTTVQKPLKTLLHTVTRLGMYELNFAEKA